MPCCVSGILLHINSEIVTDDDTLPDLPYKAKNLDKSQGQKPVDKNGNCFINLIIKCMATDFNHKIKQQDLLDQIVDELYENAK